MRTKIKEIVRVLTTELEKNEKTVRNELFTTITYCMAVGIVTNILAFVNIKTSMLMAVFSGISALVSYIACILGIVFKNKRITSVIESVVLALFFSICIIKGGNEGFVIIWLAIFPGVAMLAHGLLHGTIFSLYFVFFLFAIFYTPLNQCLEFKYPLIFQHRFPIVYTMAFISTFYGLYTMHKAMLENEAQRKELQELREQAEEANKAKSLFLSKVSHEIRTPINAVLGLNEMILRESNEKKVKNYSFDIKNSGKTLLALINDLLDQSRLEAGKIEIAPIEYSTADLINDLTNMIFAKIVEKDLDFDLDVDENLPKKLFGDSIRINQIITNILSNAVKYTSQGKVTLKISSEKIDQSRVRVLIAVQDTGIGIKQEDIERLFVPFERIEEKRNMYIEGTGLGMSITQNLLALMGSRLQVDSTYGKGSTFYFELVQNIIDPEPIGRLNTETKENKNDEYVYQPGFTSPESSVLVVDDTNINLIVFKGLLKETNIIVDTADSGEEAIQMAKNKPYDIIFLDHIMPVMDGIETLRQMKVQGINSIYIALTANGSNESKPEYLAYGFDDFLAKPIDYDMLENMLIKYLPSKKVIDIT